LTVAVQHQLIDAATGEVLVAKLEIADTFWRRFRGLQFRRPLAPDAGLLLTPCRSIHTHWMQFSIDVAMLDEEGVVIEILPGMKPWRIAPHVRGTQSIVETAAGMLSTRLRVGVRTKIAPACDDTHAM
jgi:uncharacterized membrane protein (UPF0127 family)